MYWDVRTVTGVVMAAAKAYQTVSIRQRTNDPRQTLGSLLPKHKMNLTSRLVCRPRPGRGSAAHTSPLWLRGEKAGRCD